MKNKCSKLYIVSIITLLFVLNNCGKKGPLKLEPEVMPGKLMEMKILQEGDDLMFSWKFPDFLKDNKTPLVFSSIKKIYIYYSDKPVDIISTIDKDIDIQRKKGRSGPKFSSPLFLKKSRLLNKLDFQNLQSDKGIYKFSYKKISNKFLNKKIYFATRYKYQKLTSDLSEIKEIKIMEPAEPVTDLSISNEKKVIKLNWTVKSKKTKNNISPVISGFNVFRMINSEGHVANPDFKKINSEKVLKEYYEDSDTGISGKYSYYISVLVTDSNISKPSNIVSITIKDIFPPAIPLNLHIFKSKDGLMLSWKNVNDKDLSHYKIYRRDDSNTEFSIVGTEVKENRYLDKTVNKGKNYYYYITSVDNNGNESDESEKRSEHF